MSVEIEEKVDIDQEVEIMTDATRGIRKINFIVILFHFIVDQDQDLIMEEEAGNAAEVDLSEKIADLEI
jgi:hypothetical protein